MFKASDILQTMQDSFDNKIRNDAKLRKIRKEIQEGANQAASQQYAIRSGQLLSETLKENITADLFADGEELDAAELAGALIPMMEKNHGYVSTASSAVQKYMNEQSGLGLKPVEPEFDANAAKNIVGRMSNYDSFENAEWMLGEPMVANSIGIADESLRENAEFQYKSGLRPKIIRTCESGACEWCQSLAGEYDYEEVKDRDNPVFQRHNNCQCEITFEPGDGRVENRNDELVNADEANERKAYAKKEEKTQFEEDKIKKQKRINDSFDNNGGGNYNKTPAKELAKIYDEDVDAGWISPLCGFDNYLKHYRYIENNIVGKETVNGIAITCQSRHFLQRVLGTGIDPKILKDELKKVHRDGVSLSDIENALFAGTPRPIRIDENGPSQKFVGENCAVTINPEIGKLIQCNPNRK